jgi:predicted enzyme related to lactoylglutathione lyase
MEMGGLLKELQVEAIPDMVTFANFYDPEGNRLQVAGPPPQA